MAQPLFYLTVVLVVSVLFSPNAMGGLSAKTPVPASGWASILFAHVKDWMSVHSQSSLGRIAMVGLIPLVVLVRGVVSYLNAYLMGWVGARSTCDLRARLFEHLLNLPLSFFTRISTGELISRNNDITLLQNMIGVSLVTLIQAPCTILTCVLVMLALDWRLTLLSLVVFPLCVIPISIYSRKGGRASAAIQTEAAALGKVMHESFTGNRIIKAYNLEPVMVKQFRANLEHLPQQLYAGGPGHRITRTVD